MVKQNIVGPLREQSDWEQQDENRLGFIKNKPKNIATVNDIDEAMAMAKKYTDSQRLGYEENKEIVWDGDTTGKIILEEMFVRVSEEPIDLSCVNVVTLKTGDSSLTIKKEHLTIANIDDGNTIGLFLGDEPFVVTIQKDFFNEEMGSNYYKGTYFVGNNSSFISCASLSELKTIDPKFLPSGSGGGIPTVVISTTITVGHHIVDLTTEESDNLQKAFDTRTPCFILAEATDVGAISGVPLTFYGDSAMMLYANIEGAQFNLCFSPTYNGIDQEYLGWTASLTIIE